MSLLSSIAKGVLAVGKSFLGIQSSPKIIIPKTVSSAARLPAVVASRSLPGIGTLGGAAAGALGGFRAAQPQQARRRRRKGISAKDLTSFKRVARLVERFSKPVHKMRNYKPKKEF